MQNQLFSRDSAFKQGDLDLTSVTIPAPPSNLPEPEPGVGKQELEMWYYTLDELASRLMGLPKAEAIIDELLDLRDSIYRFLR